MTVYVNSMTINLCYLLTAGVVKAVECGFGFTHFVVPFKTFILLTGWLFSEE